MSLATPSARVDLPRAGRLVSAVVALAAVLWTVRALLPMTWLGDIWRPADTASIAHNFFTGGMNLFAPQVDWGGAGPGYVEAELQLLPWLTAVLYHVFGEHVVLGRLLSVVFALAGTAVFWQLVRRVLPPDAARWALVAYAVSPALMTWGNAFMPDVLTLLCYVTTLWAFQRWLAEDRPGWLVATAAAAALAGLAKPTALNVGLVLAIWLVLVAPNRLRRPGLYLAAVAALVPPALWLWYAHGIYLEYGNTFGVLSGGDDKFGNLALWTSPRFYLGNVSIELGLVFGFGGALFAVVGAVRAWRARSPALLAAGLVSVTIFYFAVARYSMEYGPQYHVFSLPFAAILIGLGLEGVLGWITARIPRPGIRTIAAAICALGLAATGLVVFGQSFVDRSDARVRCATELDAVSQPGDLVVVATTSPAVDRGTANNFQDPTVFFLAQRKGWSLASDQQDPALVADHTRQGARYLVADDPLLIPTAGPLGRWLAQHADQVRTPATDGCSIWALHRT